ncbi:RNA-directed DNA polymerase, eukaryota, reverse transcriptase zinc-binding domain protein [Tanacetum coccineum]|uniref:RNA-directed DNA polymerase, eukaryota, reverse transcriptase zinc-binding domain protein n=1 Tax=Tanacetum coccineum TaxID=301880 RepID=A0ABQ5F6Z3_9ASTR
MSNGNKQKEVIKFIKEEKLQVCAIIETHIKAKKIKDVCDKVFGDWEWITNSHYSTNSCRIMLSWNPLFAKIQVIQVTRQSVFCYIEGLQGKVKFFCTIVYASNSKDERKMLWKKIYMHKRISGNHPWALLGDMNVTLNVEEHSCGGSHITEEMQEFRDCINAVELDDIGSLGFYFTWTKSLKNPKAKVLKKLDRVMVSEGFLDEFADNHAIFQPFLVSDHSPALLIIPSNWKKKAKSFRFDNYIVDKPEFLKEVEEGWKV